MWFWKDMAAKWKIIALAPMDWYTDSAYRQIVKKVNEDVVCFSEFYSADWIVHSKFLADSVLPHNPIEKPLIIQIFWKDPEMFRQAALIIERYWISWIDVNMGCPAKKVVQSWHWSSLMINVDTAYKIVEEMAKAVKIPISVKTRLWYEDSSNLISFCKWLENAWAKLITVHWRTYKQAFTWQADWSMIYELKKELKIPVIWNWDVLDYEDWMNKVQNLDWFMIGRASFGNPWCFSKEKKEITLQERLDMMQMHADILIRLKWRKWCLETRKHMVQYLFWFPWVKEYRTRLVRIESFEEVKEILDIIRKDHGII